MHVIKINHHTVRYISMRCAQNILRRLNKERLSYERRLGMTARQ